MLLHFGWCGCDGHFQLWQRNTAVFDVLNGQEKSHCVECLLVVWVTSNDCKMRMTFKHEAFRSAVAIPHGPVCFNDMQHVTFESQHPCSQGHSCQLLAFGWGACDVDSTVFEMWAASQAAAAMGSGSSPRCIICRISGGHEPTHWAHAA
mgnify:CR=1 FL=1